MGHTDAPNGSRVFDVVILLCDGYPPRDAARLASPRCGIGAKCARSDVSSETVDTLKKLIVAGQVQISVLGYDGIAADGIYVQEILAGVNKAAVVEDHLDLPKGCAVLVLQFNKDIRPIHVARGIPEGLTSPVVVVTAYRPALADGKASLPGERAEMKTHHRAKYVHEGKYVAKVDVELLEDETEWSPYLSVSDAYKLDDVRDTLRHGDIAAAAKLARVFSLQPVALSR